MTQPRLVGGRYELGELIGYGGMAEVHRGRDVRLGRDVAIKVLRADLSRDPSFLARFRREAQSAAGLNHPSIVAVYDTGEDVGTEGTAQPYIVMEFVEGRTLRDILKSEGRLPARRAMEIAADVAGALDFSHRAGLIHRDVKPANVMITPAGAVKVMDFGIARAVADNGATVTQTANVIGTAQYLSPEQARGETVDGRSDVYSLGCLLYELVTGVPPFQGDSPVAVAYQHVRENAAAPSTRVPDLPRAMDSIVMKALAKNPLNRYQTAADMRTDLQRALADQPVTAEAVMTDAERTQFIARTPAPPVVLPHRDVDAIAPEPEHRAGWVWAAIIVALLLVIGAASYFIYSLGSGNKGPAQVAVPSVVGSSVSAASKQMTQANLLFQPYQPGGVPSPTTSATCDGGVTVQPGQVCKLLSASGRTIAAGQSLDENSTVFYQTYKQAQVNVPYVLGMSADKAIAAIKGLGLNPVLGKPINIKGYAQGVVARQDPQQGVIAKPGDDVTIRVATGQVFLPDVTKMADADAKAALNRAGFTTIDDSQTRDTPNKNRDGKVADESPTPGQPYDPSTSVSLTIWHYVPQPVCSTVVITPSVPASSSATPTPSTTDTATPSTVPTTTAAPSPTTTVICTTPSA